MSMKPADHLPTLTLYGVNYTWQVSTSGAFYQLRTPNITADIIYLKGEWRYAFQALRPENKRILLSPRKSDHRFEEAMECVLWTLSLFTEEQILWRWSE